MASSKSVLVIGDMHVGSTTSVCSPEPPMSDKDTTHRPSKLQKSLYNHWNACIDELLQKPDLLVVNGEPCDGGNKKQLGSQSWTTNLQDQLNDAEELIKLIPYKNIILNRGRGYHVTKEGTNCSE